MNTFCRFWCSRYACNKVDWRVGESLAERTVNRLRNSLSWWGLDHSYSNALFRGTLYWTPSSEHCDSFLEHVELPCDRDEVDKPSCRRLVATNLF